MKQLFFLIVPLICYCSAHSQNVGIGTSTPSPSALLEMKSTIKGFLPPRMLAAQRDAIVSPEVGLIIYCKDCGPNGGEPEYFNGTTWVNMIGGQTAPHLRIGSSYKGGTIAYIFQQGDPGYIPGEVHGLIAAPFDQRPGVGSRWDNFFTIETGTTATGLGTGNANTNTIVAIQGPGDYAAVICSELELNGFTDWYLPSKDELHKIMINADAVGNFVGTPYWSSSEFDLSISYAWAVSPGAFTTPIAVGKDIVQGVRAVRTF
jgi:hypothetical protein